MSNTSSSLNGPGTSDNSNAYAIVEQARALVELYGRRSVG